MVLRLRRSAAMAQIIATPKPHATPYASLMASSCIGVYFSVRITSVWISAAPMISATQIAVRMSAFFHHFIVCEIG